MAYPYSAFYRNFRVYVRQEELYGSDYACDWLGHNTYKCGHCKKGYFKAKQIYSHDLKCPECGYHVKTRQED